MDGERKRSKGSFFHFFDWNGKSRKKLFENNSELSEGSEQEKENVESIAKLQVHAIEEDDRRANSSNKGSIDFSSTSSVTSDEGFGTRAPGVVARLMGLDSFPTSNVAKPSSTPFYDSASFRASQHDRSNHNLWSGYNPMDYLNNSGKQEGYAWESRSLKMQNRPIERYQTEILPPKSAKSIPITHHKLLSPIKTPGFIPTKNVAYIMEAAAKIIEASPKATINGKMPSIGTSSVPLRIQDLKLKMEAAHTASRPQRPNELFSAKNTKGHHSDNNRTRSEGKLSCNASSCSEKGASDSLKHKGKSISLSLQSKSNAQRGKGSTSRNNNIKQKEQMEIRSNQSLKSLPNTQKAKRTSEGKTGNVLRQNKQKQNCESGKESSTSKNSVSNQSGRKAQSMSSSAGHSRTANKVVIKPETLSKKVHSVVTTSERDKPSNISRKKQSVNGDFQVDRSVSHNVSCNRDVRLIKCKVATDGSMHTDIDNRKNGMDVISFTFTSPVKRATPFQSSMMGETNSCSIDSFAANGHPYFQKSTSSFSGLTIVAGDALGVLLEQKLQELTNKFESTHCNIIRDKSSGSSTSSLQNFLSTVNVVSTVPAAQDERIELVEIDKSDHPDCCSLESPKLTKNQIWQGSEEMEEHSCSRSFSFAEIDLECRHPSPVSILEPSFESASCSNTNVQSDEMLSDFSTNEFLEVEAETELSDSASSISTLDIRRKLARTFTTTEVKGSSDWELDYVKDVLKNAETMLKDLALGHAPKIINPQLFHLLENQENVIKRNEGEDSKLGRKVLFDCVSERLELMCGQAFVGSCKSWAKICMLFESKGWLAEELYQEISGWKSMGDLMVDELVDRDMSTQYGRWLDFNIEIFEEGVKIEKGILTSLVDELVSDFFIM
ncbi:uncharacterized protein LOC110622988 isoform X2 [Manihot esculenta]|uniref:Uncharacterized protein n=1 Tax=Manihot esculenta TaxID=3983 RepID=A0ACB7H7Z2_MANES|nr:uncharacterized protein LOC110622988 isoform X2 [Manihot esculenta]KAG8648306.1 hypothetical protein MANES_09G175400v8 [Manihot esculenta]